MQAHPAAVGSMPGARLHVIRVPAGLFSKMTLVRFQLLSVGAGGQEHRKERTRRFGGKKTGGVGLKASSAQRSLEKGGLREHLLVGTTPLRNQHPTQWKVR